VFYEPVLLHPSQVSLVIKADNTFAACAQGNRHTPELLSRLLFPRTISMTGSQDAQGAHMLLVTKATCYNGLALCVGGAILNVSKMWI
jgi:hypothetical protein